MKDYPRVGVGIVIRRDDQVLLIRRKSVHGSGSWSTPGGHLELGEALEECAAREAAEETGIEVENVRFGAITNDVFADEGTHYLTVWMEADVRSGEPSLNATYEMSDVAWFSWDRLPSPLFVPFDNLLEGRGYPDQDAWPRVR